MTQIANIQAPSKPAPSSDSPQNPSQDDFSPHLESAVSELNETNSAPTDKKADPSVDQADRDASFPENAASLTDIGSPIGLSTTSSTFGLGDAESLTSQPERVEKELPVLPVNKNDIPLPTELKADNRSLLSSLNDTNSALKIDISIIGPQSKASQQPSPAGNETVVQQLQNIINKSSETGTVSIQGTINNLPLQSAGTLESGINSVMPPQMIEPGKNADKTTVKIPTLRQDIQGQYLEAKMNLREQNDPNLNNQNNEQQNSAKEQQLSTSLQLNGPLSPEQSNSFQQISTLMHDLQNESSFTTSKPITLPSGTVVYEEDVMQQVIERFQVTKQSSDNRISLKLHPAELGELKVDLVLKEGTIKANVIVQNHHVMDIIDKNMSKLKTILEDQGFTIEEILVSSESDSVTDFNFFEQHLSQQNDQSSTPTDPTMQNGFSSLLEDAVEVTVGSTAGVNIQA